MSTPEDNGTVLYCHGRLDSLLAELSQFIYFELMTQLQEV